MHCSSECALRTPRACLSQEKWTLSVPYHSLLSILSLWDCRNHTPCTMPARPWGLDAENAKYLESKISHQGTNYIVFRGEHWYMTLSCGPIPCYRQSTESLWFIGCLQTAGKQRSASNTLSPASIMENDPFSLHKSILLKETHQAETAGDGR